MMDYFIIVCLFLSFSSIHGQQSREDAECRKEHGACTQHVYENIRLAALRCSNCQKFCQCVHASTELDGSVTYMWVQKTCPSNTLFDDSLPSPVCNHEGNVQCHDDDDEYCSSEHVIEDAECRKEHGACTRHEYENIRFAALRCYNCQRYCQCVHASSELDDSVTYMWVQQTCPSNTLFDDSLPSPECNSAENVQCHGDDDEDCRSEHGACTQFVYENVRLVPQTSSGCKKFCQCAHASTEADGSVTYEWIEHSCPAQTLFDSSIRVCNFADSVQCGGNQGQNELTSSRPWVQETTPIGNQWQNLLTTQTPWVQENQPIVTSDDDEDCRSEHGYCTRDQYENVRLVALKRSGCKNFCQGVFASTKLDGSVTYKWMKQTCSPGTLFDESLPTPVCNHYYQVNCTYEKSEDCTTEYGTCTKYIYENVRLVPKRSSGCEKFCQCTHASTELDGSVTYKWVEHDCPSGLLFDENIKVCNYAGNVQCSAGIQERKRLLEILRKLVSRQGDDEV